MDSRGKGLGLAMCASFLLEKASEILIKDNIVYSKKSKMLLNQLIKENLNLIKGEERLKRMLVSEETIKISKEKLGFNLDPEDVMLGFTQEQELLFKMVYIYLNIRSDISLFDYLIVINSIYNNKRVYTEEDLKNKIEEALQNDRS